MRIFGKRQPEAAPVSPNSAAPAPQPADLTKARGIITALSHAPASTEVEVLEAIRRLLIISGTPTKPVEMLSAMASDPGARQRPWRWLAEVAEQANACGLHDIAAMSFMFGLHWTCVVGPTLTAGDMIEIGLDRGPSLDLRGRLAEAALGATAALGPDFVLAEDGSASISAHVVQNWAKADLTEVRRRTSE